MTPTPPTINRWPKSRDIHTLMHYTSCSRELALEALKLNPKLVKAFQCIHDYEFELCSKSRTKV